MTMTPRTFPHQQTLESLNRQLTHINNEMARTRRATGESHQALEKRVEQGLWKLQLFVVNEVTRQLKELRRDLKAEASPPP